MVGGQAKYRQQKKHQQEGWADGNVKLIATTTPTNRVGGQAATIAKASARKWR